MTVVDSRHCKELLPHHHCKAHPFRHCEEQRDEAIHKTHKPTHPSLHHYEELHPLRYCEGVKRPRQSKTAAFSLIEMLMALLVASLLLAALAPVMTKRMNENMHITGDMTLKGDFEIEEIAFGDAKYCPDIKYDNSGNPLYCEGEYVVKEGVDNITVTAIGGGGGGGTAPTAGYMEYTEAGSTNTFTVPPMVNQLEATLISGGAGGGAGGQVMVNVDNLTDGAKHWTPPAEALNKYVNITACGAGGGAAATRAADVCFGGGGGSGAYERVTRLVNSTAVWTLYIGGGGGGGAPYACVDGKKGGYFGGGGGGGGNNGEVGMKAGLGGGLGSEDGGAGGLACGEYSIPQVDRSGYQRTPWGGGQAGAAVPVDPARSLVHGWGGGGGYGTQAAGGGGGGGVPGSGGGGGGGGPTRVYSGSTLLHTWGGGGGGSGSTCCNSNTSASPCWIGGAGGGGGGSQGGKGGDSVDALAAGFPSRHGNAGAGALPNGKNGLIFQGGKLTNSIFDTATNCSGGSAETYGYGDNGKAGAVRISYLSYGSGGSGGGGAAMVPLRNINVTPKEDLLLYIGKAGMGHKAGTLDSSGVEKAAETETTAGWTTTNIGEPSYMQRGEEVILKTNNKGSYCAGAGCASGIVGNDTSTNFFDCGSRGQIGDGALNAVSVTGFSNTAGHNAGDADGTKTIVTGGNSATNSYANKTTGGAGGTATTPFTGTCSAGKGGTSSNPKGGDASGYGCGGGGGYGLSDGGKGSGGYARLSWNMFWDAAANAYKYTEIGAGGGGASGNVITETVRVSYPQTIKIRIGAGGAGAKVSDNGIIPAAEGGTTIFGDRNFIEIKAGGGGGGTSPDIIQNGNTATLVNGKGGIPSTVCSVGATNHIKNTNRCTQGKAGKAAGDDNTNVANGGLGAAFSFSINGKTYKGLSGAGGIQSTELNNSKGKAPEDGNIASGGGGAALLIHNKVTNSVELSHPQGGNGAHGRIILKLWK